MDNHASTSRAEAERLLGLAEKLLCNKDLSSSKKFATQAQETEPLLEGCDHIIAIIEVLLASEKRVNNHPDWYSVLQIPPKVNDLDLVKRQYRKLALLLHPDKNKFAFAESAFHLVAEAWGVLSDPVKKRALDNEFGLNFTKVDLQESRRRREMEMMQNMQNQYSSKDQFSAPASGVASYSSPVKKRGRPKRSIGRPKGVVEMPKGGKNGVSGGENWEGGLRSENFWTGCPYCYHLYEYPRMYEGCCLRCWKCKKTFTAEGVGYEPPMVPGREEYYCCWGMFPMGFIDVDQAGRGRRGGTFDNWMSPMQYGGIGGGGGNAVFKGAPKEN
ncbi:chaperone [Lithospermum erythrorhizon]|uniref:Chaperone n=1 Tax=Lithospermum erythrorhizon TaxID=34254 RepID=A0AAV3Q3G9_LITER